MNFVGQTSANHRCGRSSDPIAEAATEWISRRDAGVSEDEEAEFQTWLAADPRHATAIKALQPAWSALNRLRHVGRGNNLRSRVEVIVAGKTRRRFARGITGLAAAAIIAFGFFHFRTASDSDHLAPTIAVRPDRQLLPDGSSIDLNLGAEIKVEFTAGIRAVRLVSGEALFHVTPDSRREFVVTAGDIAVRAVGTAFTVRLEPQAVDVLVTEGRVAVKRTTDTGRMTGDKGSIPADANPGRKISDSEPPSALDPLSSDIIVDAGKRVVVPIEATVAEAFAMHVSPEEVAAALAWRNRRVEFNGTPLAEAAAMFNRDNSIQLSVANPETGAIRITGVFWTNDPEAFSRAVETSLGLTATQETDGNIAFRK